MTGRERGEQSAEEEETRKRGPRGKLAKNDPKIEKQFLSLVS